MERIWLKNYDQGVSAEIDLNQFSSIADLLEKTFDKYPHHAAFHNMGKTYNFKEIDRLSIKFASYLQNNLGLTKGDRVAIMMPNILQYPVALFGILRAGMIAVNVNPLYTARELEHQLHDSGAKAIVIFANAANLLAQIISHTDIKHVIVTKVGDLLGFPKSFIVNCLLKYVKKMVKPWNIPQAVSFKAALNAGVPAKYRRPLITNEDIAFLQYTGGTTGVAKGAILAHGNIVANVLQATEWIRPQVECGKEVMITPLPLYHIFSLTANCFAFSSIGALNVLITNPRDINGFIKELKKWKFTAMTGVNTLFNRLLNNPNFATVDFSSAKICLGGGMAVQKAVADRWRAVTKTPLIEAYGLTETSPAACMNPMSSKEHNGFIGLPVPSTHIVIKNDDEEDLEIGEIGELCIKGPQVMKGYWNKPEETETVTTKDGYLKTGDVGYMTEGGFIKLVDRKKDMILVSGFNVYPNEVEDVVAQHPKVLETAAIGVPDEKSGEIIKLVIVKKDQSLTKEEIIAHCRQYLTGYKVPKIVEFRDKELPKSAVGKILRKDLKKECQVVC